MHRFTCPGVRAPAASPHPHRSFPTAWSWTLCACTARPCLIPHPCPVPFLHLIPSGNNPRRCEAPSCQAHTGLVVCQHRGAEILLRQVVTAGRRALPLRTLKIGGGAQRGKVLGASLQAQGTGEGRSRCSLRVDVARAAQFNARSSGLGAPFCFHGRFALEKPLSGLHAPTHT